MTSALPSTGCVVLKKGSRHFRDRPILLRRRCLTALGENDDRQPALVRQGYVTDIIGHLKNV
jgi:hypothetical protein